MMTEIDIQSISEIAAAVSDYYTRCSIISQLDPSQKETLDILHSRIIAKSRSGSIDFEVFRYWKEIDKLTVVSQTWGSTARGWGGMGGASMTKAHTVVIENQWFEVAFIYWDGKLAYIADMDDKWKALVGDGGLKRLPGMGSCGEKLSIIYRNTARL